MTKKVALVSIPHSGTIFVSDFLEKVVGLRHVKDYNEFMETHDMDVFIRMHTNAPIDSYINTDIWEYIFEYCEVVSPLRHPHEVFISHLAREYPNAMDMVVESWNNMKEVWYEVPDMFWFNIDIGETSRLDMIENLCYCFDLKQDKDKLDFFLDVSVRYFAANWKKVNTVPNHNEVRRAYNKTGRLPTGHDYSRLDDAVDMYNQWAEV
jgi:hypothetical protein